MLCVLEKVTILDGRLIFIKLSQQASRRDASDDCFEYRTKSDNAGKICLSID